MRAFALFLALTGPALAQGDVTGEPGLFTRLDAGILCADGPTSREAAPDTRRGYVENVRGTVELGLAARRIPTVRGLSFGVVSTLADSNGTIAATIVVTHPPMGADGATVERWDSFFYAGDQTAKFFQFDVAEEEVPGLWTIQAVVGDRILYSARFEVVPAAAMPGFVSPCREPPQVS
jgi:hypothetical protein